MKDMVIEVTGRISERSRISRRAYLERTAERSMLQPRRSVLGCANLAHGFASCGSQEKSRLAAGVLPNIAIISSYNDLLSAHKPFERFPDIIKDAVREAGGVAQFAGGVPAMCDGITQGQPGMELSLFSRDVIAMSTAIALSHNMFDGALCLGVCDKIVPGMLIGALSFGHLPVILVPAGPMASGLSNQEKANARQLYSEGKIARHHLLDVESRAYHGQGTCTFFGTANSNQMLMEMMGVHLPGSSFVRPDTPLREALTREAARRLLAISHLGESYTPLAAVVDEKAIVNGIVGLLATGGSTNHTIHLIAIARAAGIEIKWDDFGELSEHVPVLARIYPNGSADVNAFQAAGGMARVISELLDGGLVHEDVQTVAGRGLRRYVEAPRLDGDRLVWEPENSRHHDGSIVRSVSDPFSVDGGLKVLSGNLGRAVVKVSALKAEHRVVESAARVFACHKDVLEAFARGELHRDCVIVLRYQGPRANGMPELHELTPALGVLQDQGHRVALVTDGRMSGASGKVPAAIHVCPEAAGGGAIARVVDGDMIRLDTETGELNVVGRTPQWAHRQLSGVPERANEGFGRELFAAMRAGVTSAEEGASVLYGQGCT